MPRTCNKCKFGFVSESDSWCIGCLKLEASQGVLRQRWLHPGLRQICEETLLNAARLTRAFANLDRALPAGEQECAPLTIAKAKAARRPPLPTTSPCASEREAREAHSEATESPDGGNEEEEADRSTFRSCSGLPPIASTTSTIGCSSTGTTRFKHISLQKSTRNGYMLKTAWMDPTYHER